MADWHPFYAALKTLFETDSSLVALVPATRWHGDQIPDQTDLPAVRYTILAEPVHQRLADGDNVTAEVQVDGYGERQDEATVKSIMDKIVALLDRATLTVTGYSGVRSMCIQKPTPFKEDPYFRLRSRFRVIGKAA